MRILARAYVVGVLLPAAYLIDFLEALLEESVLRLERWLEDNP